MTCKFCNVHGDLDEDHDYIWKDKFDFGMLGNLGIDSYISCCNKKREPVIDIQADLTGKNGESIDLGVKRIHINFCPFCGMDLSKIGEPEELHKLSDIRDEMPNLLYNAMFRAGFKYLEDCSYTTRNRMGKFRMIGSKALCWLDDILDRYGVSYSNTDDYSVRVSLLHVGDHIEWTNSDGKLHTGTIWSMCGNLDKKRGAYISVEEDETKRSLSITGVRQIMTITILNS